MSISETVISFNKVSGSPAYERFLNALGQLKELKGWKAFAGGLDTVHGKTGKHFLYCKWKEYEVAFHCSTLLPYKNDDLQQIERKRHIGNGNPQITQTLSISYFKMAICNLIPHLSKLNSHMSM
jgi:hypothetical protein